MTSEPIDHGEDAEVVPLHAADAGTEAHLDDAAGAAYAVVDEGREHRKPIIPPHLRGADNIKRHFALMAARHGHAAAYHGVRVPGYLGLTAMWAAIGVLRTGGRLLAWWHVPDMHLLESQAAADGLIHEHLRLHKAGKETRKARGLILAIGAAVVITGLAALVAYHRWWAWALLGLVVVPALARAGRPDGKPIVQRAVLPAAVQAPTQDVITRALGALGIAALDRWIRDGHELVFPSPVREDGPGWRAEVDLPFGVTAAMVIDRRDQLASGLRRPLGAVWPEPVTEEHAGRLELYVGRADLSKVKQPPWPLLRSGEVNVFEAVPFGTDPRGRMVRLPLVFHNTLIGAIPRQGKTASLRVLVAACALDPLCELWIHELKGSGDLDPFEKVSHRFCSGVDDESIGYAAASLRMLRAEIEKRAPRLKDLPREVCPDKRVTRQIATRRALKLAPLACAIDECQNLFAHTGYGKQAQDDAEFCIKIGPAFGVFLLLATQRPDAKSLPTGVSANVSDRLCHKVMGQMENDMILGTSAYKNGIRATTFRAEIDAGIAMYVGGTQPQVVRAFYLNLPAAERVATRARQLREAAGTLSGVALGLEDTEAARDVLADLAAVFGADAGLQWGEAAARLGQRFPDRWDGASADAVSAEARSHGVPSVNVRVGRQQARGCRLADVEAAADGS
jgi:DNA segregation ATPase FtsK/SpoIIIE, S-DNA-T family